MRVDCRDEQWDDDEEWDLEEGEAEELDRLRDRVAALEAELEAAGDFAATFWDRLKSEKLARKAAEAERDVLRAEVAAKDERLAKYEAWAEADEIARTYCGIGSKRDNWDEFIKAVAEMDRIRIEAIGDGRGA